MKSVQTPFKKLDEEKKIIRKCSRLWVSDGKYHTILKWNRITSENKF